MNRRKIVIIVLAVLAVLLVGAALQAQQGVRMPIPRVAFDIREAQQPREVALSLQVLFLLSILSLAPSLIIMMTAFTRVVIVLDFVKRALSLQQMPPNQVIVGLSIFLTIFIMAPTFTEFNTQALQPYLNNRINNEQFYNRGIEPFRKFMFRQTRQKDIALFVSLAKIERPRSEEQVPTYCLIPAFMISELKRAFEIGVYIFIPFIVIDMIVASALMAMGMIM
ncbi:MAG TPA: flagellar type III secretion system pore protein FliP, partial [Spirochaetota bacterium]|nr:flagellar type III secretion system pore protein FliP [Spirochaetota bacterium]